MTMGEFIKGLRKFPIGNFASFPAEILRTGTNIVRRGLKEVNYTVTRADGTVVKPFQAIGHTRLFGFGATTVAVPYATVEMFKALYDDRRRDGSNQKIRTRLVKKLYNCTY